MKLIKVLLAMIAGAAIAIGAIYVMDTLDLWIFNHQQKKEAEVNNFKPIEVEEIVTENIITETIIPENVTYWPD